MKSPISHIYFLFVLILAWRTLSENPQDSSTCTSSGDVGECVNSHSAQGIRLIQREELESKTGENGSEIWLSILGEVYDVSAGESFYGKGKSYSGLTGTDCTVCYITGVFTAEEAAKHTDEISYKNLPGVVEWVSFYGTHKEYKFVGYLVDPRFYDEKGEPAANLLELRKLISSLAK